MVTYDRLTIGQKVSETELKSLNRNIYNNSLVGVPTGSTSGDGSPELEITAVCANGGSGGSVQIQTTVDGVSTDVSQEFGLAIRQHEDVMLAQGKSRFTRVERSLPSGDFLVVRLDVNDPNGHHAEQRIVQVEGGPIRVKVYDVTGNEGLFPASPSAMPIFNKVGLAQETTGVDVIAGFFTYATQGSDPFSALTAANDIPFYVAEGGFFTASGTDLFTAIRGRHYTPNRTYAVVIENEAGGAVNVYYQYDWHEI